MAKPRALVSVSDKRGVVEFVGELLALGYEVVSSGGTARVLRGAGLDVKDVAEITGFPEMLDGRVKTLHPMVHAGILARPTPEHMGQLKEAGIAPIDVVAVNLYPFQRTVDSGAERDEVVENIDIGGPSMVRSAAKNHERVAVIVNPDRYGDVIAEIKATGGVTEATRRALAAEAFAHTAAYDAAIANYFGGITLGDEWVMGGVKAQSLSTARTRIRRRLSTEVAGARHAGWPRRDSSRAKSCPTTTSWTPTSPSRRPRSSAPRRVLSSSSTAIRAASASARTWQRHTARHWHVTLCRPTAG